MHWTLGLLVGVILAVCVYFAYIFLTRRYSDDNLKNENQSYSEEEKNVNEKTVRMSRLQRTDLAKLPPYLHDASAQLNRPVTKPTQIIQPAPAPVNLVPNLQNQPLHKPQPMIEEYNEIRTIDIIRLPHVAQDLNIKNCIGVELIRAIIPIGEYTINNSENTFFIKGNLGTSGALSVPIGDYTIATLLASIESILQGLGAGIITTPAGFASAFLGLTSTTRITHPSHNFTMYFVEPQLAYSLGFASLVPLPLPGKIGFSIVAPNGQANFEIEVLNKSIAEIASAIQTLVRTSGTSLFANANNFNASVGAGSSPVKIDFSHSTPESFIFSFSTCDLNQSLGLSYVIAVSGGLATTGSNRIDLFGNRTVQITTEELGDEHDQNILQNIHINQALTVWENTIDSKYSQRRFRTPRNIERLTFSIKTRHPSSCSEKNYKSLELNGVLPQLTVAFRCLRYSTNKITEDTSLQLY